MLSFCGVSRDLVRFCGVSRAIFDLCRSLTVLLYAMRDVALIRSILTFLTFPRAFGPVYSSYCLYSIEQAVDSR
jgi:hypothetical protein